VIGSGATVKEAQTLMRHSDPKLTMNVYAKAGLSTVAGVMNRITLGTSSVGQGAPLMHQNMGMLGHGTVLSGTTGLGRIGAAKHAKSLAKQGKTRTVKGMEPTGIEPATPSLQR